MSAGTAAVKAWTTTYSAPELLGMMTVGMVIALLLIAVGFRLVRTVSAIRMYDGACEKVKAIEAKLEEMKKFLATAEMEYQKDIAELIKAHGKECFELQQLIFERNSEILNLKNKIVQMNENYPV